MTTSIGILHPGEMGISLAATALNSEMNVYWCSAGRSRASNERANDLGIHSLDTLEALCNTCEILISVCPPHAAMSVADEVIACNYQGIYADVNAIAPTTVKTIAASMANAGIEFVDGGIIGMPATQHGTTWLYLCGNSADKVASCFSGGPLETSVLGPEIGKASGLKMCFAANSKGTAALHTAILATAETMGVRDALEKQWAIYTPGFTEKSQAGIRQVARKAWRFSGEMKEIAATMEAAGLPREFFDAAAQVYERQKSLKDAGQEPAIEEILEKVIKK
jgi:3-hydroxyisobutyrate dehydrogenase-like beta-hydroxyacid dehydrogenase